MVSKNVAAAEAEPSFRHITKLHISVSGTSAGPPQIDRR